MRLWASQSKTEISRGREKAETWDGLSLVNCAGDGSAAYVSVHTVGLHVEPAQGEHGHPEQQQSAQLEVGST